MSYDPTFPADQALIEAAPFRTQFNGLKDLIDAVPAGPPGQNGSDGTSVTGAVIDGTNTLNPGDAAQASVSWDGANVHFNFGIPRGQDGASATPITSFIVDGVSTLNPGDPATVQTSFDGASVRFTFGIPRGLTGNDGAAGMPGSNGSDGMQGPPGAPFTNFIVDNVNQLPPGSLPNVSSNYDGTAVRLNFGIPQGNEGPQGATGPQGPPFAQLVVDNVATLDPSIPAAVNLTFDGTNIHFQFAIPRGYPGSDGGSGPQGPPGEVTNAQLNSAINGTSNNSNGVNTLVMTVSDPPTVGEMQAIASKLDELILALRR